MKTQIMDSSYPINKNITRKEEVTPVSVVAKEEQLCKCTVTQPLQCNAAQLHSPDRQTPVPLLGLCQHELSSSSANPDKFHTWVTADCGAELHPAWAAGKSTALPPKPLLWSLFKGKVVASCGAGPRVLLTAVGL